MKPGSTAWALGLMMLAAFSPPAAGQEEGEIVGSDVVSPDHDRSAPPTSLMLTLKERLSIEAALREGGLLRGKAAAPSQEIPRPRLRQPLYLSGILYSGPGAWTIWLNGQPMRHGDEGTLFSVAEVAERFVILAVDWGETTRLVRLEPHQTFVPGLDGVVEGRAL